MKTVSVRGEVVGLGIGALLACDRSYYRRGDGKALRGQRSKEERLLGLRDRTIYGTIYVMSDQPLLRVVFFRSNSGDEPVREWLKELDREDRKTIGEDIKLVQFRWPLGMPMVRKLEPDLWEVRSRLSGGRIARTCFTVRAGEMALLHGFIKKSRATPQRELVLARRRKSMWLSG